MMEADGFMKEISIRDTQNHFLECEPVNKIKRIVTNVTSTHLCIVIIQGELVSRRSRSLDSHHWGIRLFRIQIANSNN